MNPVISAGFDNFIPTDKIFLIADYRMPNVRDYVKALKETKPTLVFDFSRGRKKWSVIILENGMLIVSAIPRKQLARRMGAFEVDDEDVQPKKFKGNLGDAHAPRLQTEN